MKFRKTLFTIITTTILGSTHAQELPVDIATNKVSYADVIESRGASKKALFDKAKKWIATKNTTVNPYILTYETEQDGQVAGKGSFSLPGDRRKYVVQFAIKIAVKDGKCKYELTDLMIQFKTNAGSSSGGFSYFGGSSHHEAETLEYSIETFYPSRLNSKKPVIKWYEEIRGDAFEAIQKEMQSIASSLRQSMSSKEDW